MQGTKLTFSIEEMNAVQDNRFFFVKHEVTQKILELFGSLEKELMKKIPVYTFLVSEGVQIKEKGKIFRGENYRLLPYILLDCPRVFTTETVFSFRSMFWWGNEFSFTLHLQGKALEHFRESIQQNISNLKSRDFFMCVNDTPWEYHFEEDNYKSLDKMFEADAEGLKNLIATKPFLKFSRKMELAKYSDATHFGIETFCKLMDVLQR